MRRNYVNNTLHDFKNRANIALDTKPLSFRMEGKAPLSCVALVHGHGQSGSSFVNVIVDAGSSSVRIQWARGERCFEQTIESHRGLAVCFAPLVGCRNFHSLSVGGTR